MTLFEPPEGLTTIERHHWRLHHDPDYRAEFHHHLGLGPPPVRRVQLPTDAEVVAATLPLFPVD